MIAYRAPAWLPGGQLQTIWPALHARRMMGAPIAWRRERWDTPDGDFVDVDWLQPSDNDEAARPLLVLFHGLEGSSRSHYAEAFAGWARAHGLRFPEDRLYEDQIVAQRLYVHARAIDVIPDVMLVDIEMPRLDGFDLTRNIRADQRLKGIPIIMITSRTAEKHRNYAFEIGVNHFLGKPFQEEELLHLVAQHISAEPAL